MKQVGIVGCGLMGAGIAEVCARAGNDVIVVDQDGAVLIPAALLDDVVSASVEQERLEGWIMGQVEAGVPLPGLYPPNAENAARYQAWAKENTA